MPVRWQNCFSMLPSSSLQLDQFPTHLIAKFDAEKAVATSEERLETSPVGAEVDTRHDHTADALDR